MVALATGHSKAAPPNRQNLAALDTHPSEQELIAPYLSPHAIVAPARRLQDIALDANPSEQELIASYLSPRVVSGDRSCRFIHDDYVYASHPADLTREHAAAVSSNGDVAWYFFTAVRSKGGARKARMLDAGEGWWHSEAGSRSVASAHHGDAGYRDRKSVV